METIEEYKKRLDIECKEKNMSGISCPKCNKEMCWGEYIISFKGDFIKKIRCECGFEDTLPFQKIGDKNA